jgi:peptide/nickel transport system permease protein
VAELATRRPTFSFAFRPSLASGLRNRQLTAGLALVIGLALVGLLGSAVLGQEGLKLGGAGFVRPPTLARPLGTDAAGRDVGRFVLHAILPTLEIGLIAGGIGTLIGVVFGLLTGYLRGPIDSIVRTAADVALAVPALAVLVVISAYVRVQSIELMAVVVALFAWPFPTRAIRAQTLTLREQGFVEIARLSGKGELRIAFTEILPNLLPYIVAGFVTSVFGGILASVGLQLLGLGPRLVPTLGLMLEEAFTSGAIVRNLWWWWGAPVGTLIVLFVGLFLVSLGLDEVANPRLRRGR